MPESLREKLHWHTESGQIMDQDRRYIMLRTDVLMGIFTRLAPDAQRAALAAFGQAVKASGGQSAKAYFESLGNDAQRLLHTMQAYSADLGWGVWEFDRQSETQWQLTVHNSPFAAGFGASATPVCAAITGMLATVGELITQAAVSVEETACAAQGCGRCTFQIRSI